LGGFGGDECRYQQQSIKSIEKNGCLLPWIPEIRGNPVIYEPGTLIPAWSFFYFIFQGCGDRTEMNVSVKA
jgi:hypothetical protein